MLQVEQLLGVVAGDFQAVRFADGGLVEPVGENGGFLDAYLSSSKQIAIQWFSD